MASESESERALERAKAEGIVLVGSMASGGKTVWQVENPAKHAWYSVVRVGGGPLVCSCPAGVYGRLCKHAALVQASLTERPEPPRRTVGEMACERRAECSYLAPRPAFSMWK